jgi:pre-mRNA-splicing factor CDC5/CEF1
MIQEEMEAQKRAQAEEERAQEEEMEAHKRAQAEEEKEAAKAEEEARKMDRAADEETAGSKQVNEDQMDVDNSNADGDEFVGPIPPGPGTQGDDNVVVVEENSSSQGGDAATTDDGSCGMIDASKSGGQDHTDSKDELPTVGASLDDGSAAASSDRDVSTEVNATVPE